MRWGAERVPKSPSGVSTHSFWPVHVGHVRSAAHSKRTTQAVLCRTANASTGGDGVKPRRHRGIQGPFLNASCEMCRWRNGASLPAVATELRSQPTARCRLDDLLDSHRP